jgi:hypothetical protein
LSKSGTSVASHKSENPGDEEIYKYFVFQIPILERGKTNYFWKI